MIQAFGDILKNTILQHQWLFWLPSKYFNDPAHIWISVVYHFVYFQFEWLFTKVDRSLLHFFVKTKNTPLIWRKNVLNVLNKKLPKLVNNSSMEITEICFGFNSRSDGNAQDKLNRFRICWQSLFTQNCQNSNVSGLTKIFWWQSKEPLMLEDSVFENVAESLNHL